MMQPAPIVLGLDPGFGRVGWCVLTDDGKGAQILGSGLIETTADDAPHERLRIVADRVDAIIAEYHPTLMSLEEIFFSKNAKTVIPVAQARGVLLLAAARAGIPVESLGPGEIKVAVTGYGRADKQQMQKMIATVFHLPTPVASDDTADAMASAWTALQKHRVMRRLERAI